jgi:hypothetical protein
MGFMWINMTPHLYIVFNMLFASHFDVIPLKYYLQSLLIDPDTNSDGSPNNSIEEPFTENMGLFGYETSLFYLNIIDSFLVVCILAMTYVFFRIAKLIPIKWM